MTHPDAGHGVLGHGQEEEGEEHDEKEERDCPDLGEEGAVKIVCRDVHRLLPDDPHDGLHLGDELDRVLKVLHALVQVVTGSIVEQDLR